MQDVDAAHKVSFACQGSTITRSIADTNTIQYFNERGMNCAYPNGIAGQSCVTKFVTENALAAVRDFTGCPTMNGVEIEGQDTTQCTLQVRRTLLICAGTLFFHFAFVLVS